MDLVGLKIETALVMEQCLHHFILFEMNWHGHKFLWSCTIWGSHSSAAKDSFLLGCDIVSLGEWFPVFGRYYNVWNIRNYSSNHATSCHRCHWYSLELQWQITMRSSSHLYRKGKWFIIPKRSATKGIWCTAFGGKYSYFTWSTWLGNHIPSCSGTKSKSK